MTRSPTNQLSTTKCMFIEMNSLEFSVKDSANKNSRKSEKWFKTPNIVTENKTKRLVSQVTFIMCIAVEGASGLGQEVIELSLSIN
jgi:hypothetical protein